MAESDAARRRRHAEISEMQRKHRFAEALARAEFGRFYWNDDLERRLREQPSKPARQPAAGRAPRKPAG